ncbi:MAG TPA: MFS transporter [Nitriliruptorales bacterium]|nr:MFS transporter [Nitriliruptorales bacterium]
MTQPAASGRSLAGRPPYGSARGVAGALALLTAVRLVTNTGYRFLYPFLPVVARGLGVSIERAGLLVSAMSLGGVAAPIVTGLNARAGERHRRLAAFALLSFAMGTAVAAATTVYVGVLAGFVLLGVAKPLYDVAAHSYLADRTAYERRARVLAVIELTWAGALLVGAPAVGWLIDRAGWQAPLWVLAALALASLAAMPLVLEPDRPQAATRGERSRLDRSSLALLAAMAVFTYAAEVTFVVFGAWLEEDFGLSVLALGGLSTFIGVAELVGSGAVVAFADRVGKRRSVAIGLVVSAGGFALVPATDQLTTGLASLAVALLGFEYAYVAAIPLASESRPGARSRYLALVVVATTLPRALAAATGPTLFTAIGVAANAALSVAANLAGLVLLLAFVDERDPARPVTRSRGGKPGA